MGSRATYLKAAQPKWLNDIYVQRAEQRRAVFLLYFNIRDVVFDPAHPPGHPDELVTVEQFLAHAMSARDLVLGYSLHGGIEWTHPTATAIPSSAALGVRSEGSGEQLWRRVAGEAVKDPYPLPSPGQASDDPQDPHHWRSPARALPLLTRLLTRGYRLKETAQQAERTAERPIRVGLIIDYLHHLAPTPGQFAAHSVPEVVEALQRLSTDPTLPEVGHIVLMLAPDLASIHPELQGSDSRIAMIRIPRPDPKQRQAFLQWLAQFPEYALLRSDGLVAGLARQTAGMNFVELRDFVRSVTAAGADQQARVDELLKSRRAEIIQRESGGVLVPMSSDFGIDAVAGYGYARRFIDRLVSRIRNDRADLAGVLFAGPPGTGKSFFARALAKESQINVVTMRNVRNMYVGQSERNFEQALEVARSLAPVVIFVDEIDQAFSNRRGRQQLDGGVEQRLLGRLLEFMDDKANLGKVIWIAASNRPDLIDDALISRFRLRIPFLLPDFHACRDMLQTKLPAQGSPPFAWQPTSWTPEIDRMIKDDVVGRFSGRELETIVRSALWRAELDEYDQAHPETWADRKADLARVSPQNLPPDIAIERPDGGPPQVHAFYLRYAIREASVGHNVEEYKRQSLLALQSIPERDDELVRAIEEVLPDLAPRIISDGRIDKDGIAQQLRYYTSTPS